ncbi:ParB/RepB/Spo0J family partition protein [Rhodobaculum claviforme]|uniref:Chromosome partitioning protein ParB n=1 Tax=Rhodobaculum claviforme TaxID=1549854 RepID=A0A934TKS4_9RHOB|nr:ParB/RepB/Spo0J family partition protein [Rhodobaculum claviforme]MBK5927042.1 chromosome partitioning protein ParB [Rhodobaculum claviforme]
MSERKERRGLGRGLSALMAEVSHDAAAPTAPSRPDLVVPVEQLHPNPEQPRRHFAAEALEELSASIRAKGIIQPLIVRPIRDRADHYEIVAGERRWRAAQMAQLHDVPVIVRDFSDTEVLEVAIIENIQRADLNPLEEALGFRQLMDRFGHTQERLAAALGKSRSHIANLLRLLQLPEEVQVHLREGRLTAGHARTLVTASDPESLAKKIIDKGLSVRAAETLARDSARTDAPTTPRSGSRAPKDADTRVLEQDLSANLGMSVVVDHRPGGEGRVTIQYKTIEQLDQLCQLLGGHG